jgi:hypothetical protein
MGQIATFVLVKSINQHNKVGTCKIDKSPKAIFTIAAAVHFLYAGLSLYYPWRSSKKQNTQILNSVADPCLQIKAQTLENVLKLAHIPYISACLLQIDADPDPAYQFYEDPDPAYHLDFFYGSVWIRIRIFNRY